MPSEFGTKGFAEPIAEFRGLPQTLFVSANQMPFMLCLENTLRCCQVNLREPSCKEIEVSKMVDLVPYISLVAYAHPIVLFMDLASVLAFNIENYQKLYQLPISEPPQIRADKVRWVPFRLTKSVGRGWKTFSCSKRFILW